MLWETLPKLTWHASSCSQQPPRGHTSMASSGSLKQSLGMLHPAANRHPKATHPRGHTSMASSGSLKQSLGMLHPAANRHPKATHPWLLLGVQACRLPALKPSKRSKPLNWHASSCSQQAPQGHTSMASYGRPSLPFASP